MYHSKNTIVRSCFNHATLDANSCLDAKNKNKNKFISEQKKK